MHILIGLITAIATLLYTLDRIGVDIGWLNPWAWGRRRRWIKQLSTNPAFNLDSPMEATALLLLAVSRIDGDLSSEEKSTLRQIFEETFSLSSKDASSLLSSTTYLLGDGSAVFDRPDQVLERSLQKFTPEQKESSADLLKRMSEVGGGPSEAQLEFVSRVRDVFEPDKTSAGWQ